ncbi:hypothetical protein OCU04_007332 [Sclerotinia nivalis]|uniref:Uncharacterized protein n=1 Tax=Sclerotinia nivalis TaxID=352851 RepID=A0A9X0AIK4_9HELO|nr:hypothetical protein OCU04_007332 [Sclerotinia nivalis]
MHLQHAPPTILIAFMPMRAREVRGTLRPDPPEEARVEEESRVRSKVFSVEGLIMSANA